MSPQCSQIISTDIKFFGNSIKKLHLRQKESTSPEATSSAIEASIEGSFDDDFFFVLFATFVSAVVSEIAEFFFDLAINIIQKKAIKQHLDMDSFRLATLKQIAKSAGILTDKVKEKI